MAVSLVRRYLNSSSLAQQAKKPFIMFETNTASCGGFLGISNSYGAALWAIDYGMQLAYGNFSNGLFHTGGQNASYNVSLSFFFFRLETCLRSIFILFCRLSRVSIQTSIQKQKTSFLKFFSAPPRNGYQWTVGAIYYSAIVLAEAFGKTNTSRIIDLEANGGNVLTPAYAIYERNTLSKIALINYMDDGQTGKNDLSVTVQVPRGVSRVQVKYVETVLFLILILIFRL